jgi:MSHA biogenesis protein MshO
MMRMTKNAQSGPPQWQRGFTMVELITVIVITGIIGAMVAMFIRLPVQGYVDSARRAEMTDIANTALQRMSRDLRLALPNSVRVTVSGGNYYLEFIPTAGGGRYRTFPANTPPATAAGNVLDFSAADASFDVFAPLSGVGVQPGNTIAIYNLGIPGASAYNGDNTAQVNAIGAAANPNETTLTLTAAKLFPFDSPGHRFQIITTPVTYVCAPAISGSNGSGTLTRWWGYPTQAAQPTALPPGASSALLANYVSGCNIYYNAFLMTQHEGLATLALSITEEGESISLYSAAHIDNAP